MDIKDWVEHKLKGIFKSELLYYTGTPEYTPCGLGVSSKGTFPPIGSVYMRDGIEYIITAYEPNDNPYSAHPWTVWGYKKSAMKSDTIETKSSNAKIPPTPQPESTIKQTEGDVMDMNEILALKSETEQQIREKLREFEEKTHLDVHYVSIREGQITGRNHYILGIELDVRL